MPTERKKIVIWLFTCCALVFLMVMVGAITRLTELGLSITEWKPVSGAVPPLNEAQWNEAFALYKQSPEFQKKNSWMDLGDFKKIFFWEWLHRLLGRLIGVTYALPLIWFWARRQIPDGYKLKLLGVFVLGGLQGAMGWYMVQSGLVDRPEVSHYRLAAHLLLALLIYACMFWLTISLRDEKKQTHDKKLFIHGCAALLFLIITITWGAFTAGLDAGLIYNDSFPKMGGQWLPPDMWHLSPEWLNFLQNHAAVQFTHRWLAIATFTIIAALWAHGLYRQKTFLALHAALVMAVLQAGLGIATLFSGVWLPLAAAHQAGAVILLTLLIINLHRFKG